jgi:ribosome-binding ATPase
MECGIVGPPSSGKSTLFSILTNQEPGSFDCNSRETRRGVAKLNDHRLDELAAIVKARKIVHATVDYVDVPGFAAKSDKPEPYPAWYLSELRGTDMLAIVVRDFENPIVSHPSGSIDPLRDLSDAAFEFIISDLDVVERRLNRVSKLHDKESKAEAELLEKCRAHLSEDGSLRDLEFTQEEQKKLRGFSFLSLKPLLVILNLGDENAPEADARLRTMQNKVDCLRDHVRWVAVAAGMESEINMLDEEERAPFMEELGFSLPALDRIIKATFELMGMITFLTIGPKESRAWSVTKGATAVKAARVIHEDIARGFIRAEMYNWKDLLDAGSEAEMKKTGKMRLEGKDYIMQDGDVMNVRFNV